MRPRPALRRLRRPRLPTALLLAMWLPLSACDETTTEYVTSCDVTLHGVKPVRGTPGDQATLYGRPFTSSWDTAVYVGAVRATVVEVTREGCDACDRCIDEMSCNLCGDCTACDPTCRACLETVTFQVPPSTPGESTVQLFNRHGQSNPIRFVVDPAETAADTGTSAP